MLSFSADEIFKIGMEIELNGKTFYDTAAGACEDPDAKQVMEYLRDEEQKHYDSFSTMREALPEGAKTETVFDPDGQMGMYLKALADSRVFTSETQASDLAKTCNAPAEVFQVALRFEKDSVLLFQTMKEATKPEWGQDKIDLLIEAEKEHIRKISEALAKLEG
jgi:rubrerythrin